MTSTSRGRLGLYIDAPFERAADGSLRCAEAIAGFMRFAAAVGGHFDGFSVIARRDVNGAAGAQVPAGVEHLPLPGYPSLRSFGALIRALPGTVAGMWRALARVETVWVSAPYPFALLLVVLAKLRRRRVVLLFRQDGIRYYRSRVSSRAWAPLLAPVGAMVGTFKLLARWIPATVVGDELASRFKGGEAPLPLHVTLVSESRLVEPPRERRLESPIGLLTVGRVATEKAPAVWAAMLARLNARMPGRFRAIWVGSGPLAPDLRDDLRSRGLEGMAELEGFIPPGPELWARYDEADLFVHVAVTEGAPAALVEAMAASLPIVGTDVGGVRALLGDGACGVLVPPGDPEALADAVGRLAADPDERLAMADAGRTAASEMTIERESARAAEFIGG